MATVVNTTPASSDNNSGFGFLLGMIVLVVFVALLIFYGIPMITRSMSSSTPQVNVPGKVDVNVHNTK